MCEKEYKDREWLKEQFEKYKTPNAVAQATGYPRTCITRYATKYNLYTVKFNRTKTNPINEKYFSNIDTPDKAYFLGFIMADGNMYLSNKNKYQFSVKIKNTDIDILYKFADAIDFPKEKIIIKEEYRNNTVTKCAELKSYNQEFCSYLVDLGVVPRKTGKEKMPNLKEDLVKDFIRGYIDGDGWISESNVEIGVCSSSYGIIDNIQKYIHEKLDIDLTVHDNSQVYTVRTSKRKYVYQILKHFYYKSCTALDRKQKLAMTKKQEIIEDLIGSL